MPHNFRRIHCWHLILRSWQQLASNINNIVQKTQANIEEIVCYILRSVSWYHTPETIVHAKGKDKSNWWETWYFIDHHKVCQKEATLGQFSTAKRHEITLSYIHILQSLQYHELLVQGHQDDHAPQSLDTTFTCVLVLQFIWKKYFNYQPISYHKEIFKKRFTRFNKNKSQTHWEQHLFNNQINKPESLASSENHIREGN